MKIPLSVRNRYDEIRPKYVELKGLVDAKLTGKRSSRWHYESRVKELESYALKLETGRETHPGRPEDMFGCTIVVENHSKIFDAAALITELFREEYRRPADPKITSLLSHSFAFDDLRLYVCWKDDDALPPTICRDLLFEVQIKTFLQHAWGIATHDLIYKADEISWGTSRVAFQVKAMLENAELSITQAKRLTDSVLLDRGDKQTRIVNEAITDIKSRWHEPGILPNNILGLAQNVIDLARTLRLDISDVWRSLDAGSAAGRGAKTLNLSPYGAILESLVLERGATLFQPLGHVKNNRSIFVPLEIELPVLSPAVLAWVITPAQ
jgi:ppGpp synthetase/RelA/SpoT-type nucleotidyltranferase